MGSDQDLLLFIVILGSIPQNVTKTFRESFFAQLDMGPEPQLTADQITRIHSLYKIGFSSKKIVRETGLLNERLSGG